MSLEAEFALRRGDFSLRFALEQSSADITALFGPSGCGKTTVLRCLAGLERPRGYCRASGAVWLDSARGVFVPAHRRGVGMVFQDARLFPHLDVAGNLRYAAKRAGAGALVPQVVETLSLEALLRRRCQTLSGGERQRVALGRALLSRPRLLLLDEPLSALDESAKREILPYLTRIQSGLGIPVLYVTHSLEEVAHLARRVVLMERGGIVATGSTAELMVDLRLPLAQRRDAGALLEGVLEGHEPRYRLATVRVGESLLRVPHPELGWGEPVRLRVQARDVSIALDPPGRTSILNVLPARVAAVEPPADGQCLVRLALVGGEALLARVSERSRRDLGLEPGVAVYAQVKSIALV